jgi:hypothetical protein
MRDQINMTGRKVSEVRKMMRSLDEFGTEIILGNYAIEKCGPHDYAERQKDDQPEPQFDYNSYTYGFNERFVIYSALCEGAIKEDK